MAGTEGRFDADTLNKIDLINHKIDEINQRKTGVRTTWVEDELDRMELDDYIKGLNLTDQQQRVVDRLNRNTGPVAPARNDWMLFFIMTAGLFLQVYIGFEVYRLISKGSLEMLEAAYLVFLVLFFTFNTFQMLRYLRIVR